MLTPIHEPTPKLFRGGSWQSQPKP
jgi:hypothetical protein